MEYVELHCKSNFSFLEGASHADELIEQAARLGYSGLAVTDRNSLAGIVRAHTAAKELQFRMIVGAEIHPIDGPPLVLWPSDRASYGRLCQLITRGRMRREKGGCSIHWADVAEFSQGMLAGLLLRQPADDKLGQAIELHAMRATFEEDLQRQESELGTTNDEGDDALVLGPTFAAPANSVGDLGELPPAVFDSANDEDWLRWCHLFRDIFDDRGYLLSSLHRGVDDRAKLGRLAAISQRSRLPLVATGDVQYHVPERMVLHDCMAAIAFGGTVHDVRGFRPTNSQFALRPVEDIQKLYRDHPQAIACTSEIASRIDFGLEQLRYEYPVELAPQGQRPIDYLKRLTWQGAKQRYNGNVPDKVIQMLKHEVGLIEELHYEAYFLTVWDLVRFARERGILCQGRGSAANSIVCYCLGVTSVDPNQLDLLFERFISRERNEAPDIDVDFEHERREEVLQYIYEKYGRHRSGMTATVITYRLRSAVRDCGKALGISLDRIDELAKIVDGRSNHEGLPERIAQVGIDPQSEIGRRFLYLVQTLLGFPRHLSQHVGGMVMTQGVLCEMCPMENAAMDGRTVIQWDKDDLDALGILKVDCLSLGMLTAIHRCFDLVEQHYQRPLTLATVPKEDVAVYDMICRADTVGVFQIESRAQMSMLPRLKPRCYYDLVIEVAIVRPGPIQGQMVHPYLKARKTGVQPEYPTEAIRQVLAKTMGVPIFQEQAMKLAVVAAGFTPGEADQLRRAMAAFRRPGIIDKFRQKLIAGMLANGLDEEFAERVFTQIRGFGEYGFPESHAASFALLVYVSSWLKCHYPAVFCAAIVNSQPMGFYAPAQLIQDAQHHGVTVRGIDINHSHWDCTLEPIPRSRNSSASHLSHSMEYALRVGLRLIRGVKKSVVTSIVAERQASGPYVDLADVVRRTRVGQAVMTRLADAGALGSLAGDRRAAIWQAMAQEKSSRPLPLFDAFGADTDDAVPEQLQRMSRMEEVYADYGTTGISLRGHPIGFLRDKLAKIRVTPAGELPSRRNGQFIRVAGIVLLRQRPSTAKGITFVTLEDETGSMNLVIKTEIWSEYYMVCKRSNAWLVHGVLETRENVTHVLVARVFDLSEQIGDFENKPRDFR